VSKGLIGTLVRGEKPVVVDITVPGSTKDSSSSSDSSEIFDSDFEQPHFTPNTAQRLVRGLKDMEDERNHQSQVRKTEAAKNECILKIEDSMMKRRTKEAALIPTSVEKKRRDEKGRYTNRGRSHESKMFCNFYVQLVNQGEIIQKFQNKLLIVEYVAHDLNL